jgi:hypothetical protein
VIEEFVEGVDPDIALRQWALAAIFDHYEFFGGQTLDSADKIFRYLKNGEIDG